MRDVLVGERVVRRVLRDAAREGARIDRHQVDQIEDLADVDREGLLALPDEHRPGCAQLGNVHVVAILARVSPRSCGAGESLGADEIVWLGEDLAAVRGIGHRLAIRPRSSSLGHDVEPVGFLEVERAGIVTRAHGADVLERHRDFCVPMGSLTAAIRHRRRACW